LGLSGKELAKSLPDKQLQPEFSDNFKLSEPEGSCSFSGFQPCKTAIFKAAFPKLKFWESLV
jgi:hypothetical protein